MSVSDLLLITGYSLQYIQVVYIKTELNHKHVKESESKHNKMKFPGKTHSPKTHIDTRLATLWQSPVLDRKKWKKKTKASKTEKRSLWIYTHDVKKKKHNLSMSCWCKLISSSVEISSSLCSARFLTRSSVTAIKAASIKGSLLPKTTHTHTHTRFYIVLTLKPDLVYISNRRVWPINNTEFAN